MFIFIILFLVNIEAIELGISPPSLSYTLKIGEKVCKNVSLDSNEATILNVRDKWSDKNAKNLNYYNLSRQNFGIEIFSPNQIPIGAKEKVPVEICFSGKNSGTYYGAVIFETYDKHASIGTWVELKIKNNQTFADKITLTGKTIENKISVFATPKNIVLGSSLLVTISSVFLLVLILSNNKNLFSRRQ